MQTDTACENTLAIIKAKLEPGQYLSYREGPCIASIHQGFIFVALLALAPNDGRVVEAYAKRGGCAVSLHALLEHLPLGPLVVAVRKAWTPTKPLATPAYDESDHRLKPSGINWADIASHKQRRS